jgi:sugar porter (SP) family MFS transporter
MLPAIILLGGLFFFPRSPRWLITQDRHDEALLVLSHLNGARGNLHDPTALAELQEIKEAVQLERELAIPSIKGLFSNGMFKRLFLGMSIQAWSQLCGMNIMMYYIVYIMEAAGIGNPLLTASIQYILNVLFTLPAILLLDKIGRRPALLFGSFFMMSWLFISGALQAAYGHKSEKADSDVTWELGQTNVGVSKAVVALSYLFVATFATTWGPVSWTYPSEIFPLKIRAKAVSIATATNWFFNCLLGYAVPPLLRAINWKMYMVFGAFNGLAFIHMFLMAPETKGRTLEEMDELFNSGVPAWKSSSVDTNRLERIRQDIEKGKA